MAMTASVSATSWTGAVSSSGGAAMSSADSAPPAAPTAAVERAADPMSDSASWSPERPSWCWRRVSRSRTGTCGARSVISSASHLPLNVALPPAARTPDATSAVRRASSRPRSRASRSWCDSWATTSPSSSRRTRSPLTPPTPGCSLGALAADQSAALVGGQLAAVVHQEAARAGELVALLGQHADRQLLAGQVRAGQLERLVEVRFVDVDAARLRLGATRLELLEAVLTEVVGLGAAGLVVVGGHGQGPLLSCPAPSQRAAARFCARPACDVGVRLGTGVSARG